MRKTVLTLHMYLAAFFAPAVVLVALSGGLYLVGIKGSVEQETIFVSDKPAIDPQSDTLKADVTTLLADAGVESFNYEYVKVKGDSLYTRPTSSDHYVIKIRPTGSEVIFARPDLQSRMIELHKGHGPTAFKTFQTAFSVGLTFIMISGLWLGISASRLRRSTLLTASAGALVFAVLLL
ncbi:MAG: hypothetical protein ABJN62_13590 [Halioglobus sp.]